MVLSRSGLVNLRVLAHVQRGDKLNAHYQLFQIEPGSPGIHSILRKLRGDSRQVTVDAIATLVDDCLTSVTEGNTDIVVYLHNAVPGIHNLLYTYRDDVTTCAALEIVLDKLNAQIGEPPSHQQSAIECQIENINANSSWLDEEGEQRSS